ncbi:FkbM family methyltransferase [Halobacterium yunchengense]|uniref:FkbM family methyltransferase n=1 Tax=Halobacterium yunchengense TaxID=3108497 RepID=UPI003009CF03
MVESALASISEHLEWRYLRLRYRINSGKIKRSIRDVESSFQVNTFREFLRVVDYQNEDFVIERLLDTIDPDDIFWDIGANIGTHSCYIGQISNQTIAIEPFPDNAQQARKNCRMNNIDATILEYALGESSGRSTLTVPDTDESVVGVGTFSLQNDSPNSESIDVEVIAGDRLIQEQDLPLPDVIKIDVEGGELDVLRGFHRGLQNARVVLVEVHPRYVEQEKITDILESEGFSVSVLRQRNDEVHVFATRH